MDFKIQEKPAFGVVGKALRVATDDDENLQEIPKFWKQCVDDGTHAQILALAEKSSVFPNILFGICMDFADDMKEFTYMIAAEGTEDKAEHGFMPKVIPGLTWATFEGSGPMPEAIQTMWSRIWSEFFPAGEYEYAPGPALELYPTVANTDANYQFQIWTPVVKKQA